MSTVRMIFGLLTSLTQRKPVRRCARVQCQPSGERMEPRALLSDLKVGVATLAPPHTAGGALVTRAKPVPPFSVSYQPNREGASSDTTHSGVVNIGAIIADGSGSEFAAAPSAGPMDVGDGPADGRDGTQNHFSDGDDVVDQGNVENNDPSSP